MDNADDVIRSENDVMDDADEVINDVDEVMDNENEVRNDVNDVINLVPDMAKPSKTLKNGEIAPNFLKNGFFCLKP